jgi:isopenicillin N synthase-like dioxygenase
MQLERIDYRSSQADRLLTESLEQTGFAVLSNHPIEGLLIESVYQEWQEFFSSDRKQNYRFDPEQQTGYFPFKIETAKGNNAPDLKEFYHLYQGKSLPAGISDRTWQLFQALIDLGSELLGWIEQNLPVEVKQKFSIPLAEMINRSDRHLLRILHYPPILDSDQEHSIRAAAHEDINLITLLPGATSAGLEILNRAGWQAIHSQGEDLVINVGDMLQLATANYLRSTTHRVVNPLTSTESRYSMPMFLHARPEVVLSEEHTVDSYLQERLRAIGLK